MAISTDKTATTFTPGPWAWFGNAQCNNLYLATIRGGRRFVMQFGRWGMKSAQPFFQSRGVMKPATEFLTFEVGNQGIVGYEAAKGDSSVYRYDIAGIDHFDARLIAASPELFESCQSLIAGIDRWAADEDGIPTELHDDYTKARQLIAGLLGQEASAS